MWAIEDIPDKDDLYIRVAHSNVSRDKMPRAAAFSNTPKDGTNLSCDWSEHCTPESSRELVGLQVKKNGEFKDPSLFYFWSMNAGKLRNDIIPVQKVIHEPIYNNPEIFGSPNNRAHSIIEGQKPENNAEFRVLMVLSGKWVIGPDV